MSQQVSFIAAGLCLVSAACASAPTRPALSPTEAYREAIASLREDDLTAARRHLAATVADCTGFPLGDRAALTLAVVALDPRSPDPDLAAALSASYLGRPDRIVWVEELAETLYLLALHLGGDPKAAAEPGADGPAASAGSCASPSGEVVVTGESPGLPQLGVQPLPARLAELEQRIQRLQEELQRIQETLRP